MTCALIGCRAILIETRYVQETRTGHYKREVLEINFWVWSFAGPE